MMTEQAPLTASVVAVNGRKQPNPWWVAVICSMASYIDTGISGAFATVLVIYQGAVGLTANEVGLLTGLFGIGIASGALIGGRLGDLFGRRKVFTATMIVIVAGVAVLLFSAAFPVLVVGALVMGLGVGADIPVAFSTMTEAARSDRQRGRMIALTGVFTAIGGISAAVVGGIVGNMGLPGAQILLGQLAVIAIIVLILRLTIPESASWLLAREERRRGIETVRADRSSVKELLQATYRAPFLALLAFQVLVLCAAVPSTLYATYLLHNYAGVSIADSALVGLAAIPVAIVGIFLSFVQLGSAKRRFPMFTIGAILVVVSPLIPVVFGFSLITYLAFILPAGVGAALAGDAIIKFWASRAFPTLLRNTALGTITSVGRFAAAGFSIIVPALLVGGVPAVFITTSTLLLIGVGIASVVFRTRDKHSEFETEDKLESELDDSVPAA
jgi:inositol transporter-like SP family MFS transporter